jgi:hypothetical protein
MPIFLPTKMADVRGSNGRTPPDSGRAGHRRGMAAHSPGADLELLLSTAASAGHADARSGSSTPGDGPDCRGCSPLPGLRRFSAARSDRGNVAPAAVAWPKDGGGREPPERRRSPARSGPRCSGCMAASLRRRADPAGGRDGVPRRIALRPALGTGGFLSR